MPYGEESAYAAQAALKKKSPAYMKSSGFKMKSPLKHPHPEHPHYKGQGTKPRPKKGKGSIDSQMGSQLKGQGKI